MDFQLFIDCIPKIIHENLGGELSHQKMCPPERNDLMKTIDLETINPREAAVMMLFYPKNDKTHLSLIVRNSYNGVHSSQIAFPGGKIENSDANFQETALRETEEEIGVNKQHINIIKPFTKVYIPPSNFMVYPFLGYSETEIEFILDPTEVAGIIELPLIDFLDDNIVISRRIATSYNVDIDVPAFKINEHIVWGATAMMLSELKDVLKKVL